MREFYIVKGEISERHEYVETACMEAIFLSINYVFYDVISYKNFVFAGVSLREKNGLYFVFVFSEIDKYQFSLKFEQTRKSSLYLIIS